MALNQQEQALVLEIVAQEWARLAVKHAGSVVEVDNPYFLFYGDKKRERALRRADNARRVVLSKIILKWTNEAVPQPDKDSFIRPYTDPRGTTGKRMYVRSFARAEVRRLVQLICSRSS